MNKYRVSKYNPIFRNEKGIYTKDEWTSYSDIGKRYGQMYLKKEDYLLMENKYCEAIYDILINNNIHKLKIDKLERYLSFEEIECSLRSKGLEIFDEDQKMLTSLENGKNISIDSLDKYLRLILRESFWCEFISNNPFLKLVFGYDYYFYIYCDNIDIKIIEKNKNIGIFIEKI